MNKNLIQSKSDDIVTENLRLFERLLYQFRDVFNRQSQILTSSNKNL